VIASWYWLVKESPSWPVCYRESAIRICGHFLQSSHYINRKHELTRKALRILEALDQEWQSQSRSPRADEAKTVESPEAKTEPPAQTMIHVNDQAIEQLNDQAIEQPP